MHLANSRFAWYSFVAVWLGKKFSLFQGSLTHCKHIISNVLCIPETRDIVCLWLLGSSFVKTKFYQRNSVQDLYCGEKCKNTVWKMSVNNSDCVICEITSDWYFDYTPGAYSWKLNKELFKEVSQLFAAFYIHRLNYALPLRTSMGGTSMDYSNELP